MSFRRALMMRGADAPSADLVFYDAIKSDGVAYIDTGFVLNGRTDVITAKFQSTALKGQVVFGFRNGYSSNLTLASSWSDLAKMTLNINSNSSVNILGMSGYTTNLVSMIIDLPNGIVTGNNGTQTSIVVSPSLASQNIFLFANNGTGSYSRTISKCIISEFSVKRNGIVVLDLLACTYNDVAGMWDLVTNTFFGNANTSGEFSVSND